MATPALSHSVALAPDGEGYLAFDIATGRLLHLNPAAALVAELCDGTRTVDEIAAALSPLFEHADPDGGGAWIRESIESGLLTTTLPDDPLSAAESAAAFTAHTRGLRNQGLVLSAFVCQWHAAHLHASDPSYWFDLGELAHIVGRRAEAREAYERYLEATPDDAEIGHLLISLRDEEPPTRASNRCIEQLYERFASFYDESMRGDLDYRAPELLDRAVRTALKGRSGLNVLELGCGTGLAGRLLRAYAGRLTGIDLSAAMLARAADTNIYDRLEQAEIVTWLGGSDERFDLIAACDTLIYFGDLRQILVPASQHLKRGGLFAFTVEQDDEVMLRLTDSGRYAHHTDHIREASTDAGLAIEVIEAVTLRYEYGDAVRGLVAVLSLNDAGRVSAPWKAQKISRRLADRSGGGRSSPVDGGVPCRRRLAGPKLQTETATQNRGDVITVDELRRFLEDSRGRFAEILRYYPHVDVGQSTASAGYFPTRVRKDTKSTARVTLDSEGLVAYDSQADMTMDRDGNLHPFWLSYEIQRHLQLAKALLEGRGVSSIRVVLDLANIERFSIRWQDNWHFEVGEGRYTGGHERIERVISLTDIHSATGPQRDIVFPAVKDLMDEVFRIFGVAKAPAMLWDSDGKMIYVKGLEGQR